MEEAPYPSPVTVDGFTLSMIVSYDDCGDAAVVAPDGSPCGLVWATHDEVVFEQVIAPSSSRWGVWAVALPLPMTTDDEASRYLEALLPDLRLRWEAWKGERA